MPLTFLGYSRSNLSKPIKPKYLAFHGFSQLRCSLTFLYLELFIPSICLGGAGGDGGKGQRGKTNLDKVPARPESGNAKEVYDRGVPDPNHPEDQFFQKMGCCCFDGYCYEGNGQKTVVRY